MEYTTTQEWIWFRYIISNFCLDIIHNNMKFTVLQWTSLNNRVESIYQQLTTYRSSAVNVQNLITKKKYYLEVKLLVAM